MVGCVADGRFAAFRWIFELISCCIIAMEAVASVCGWIWLGVLKGLKMSVYKKQYEFEIHGETALLMHRDDIDFADRLEAWRKDRNNRGQSKAGDDRSPPWTWHGYLYYDENGVVSIPYELVFAALKVAGTQLIWKKQKTFKEKTQSGIQPLSEFFEFGHGSDGRSLNLSQLPGEDKKYVDQKKGCEALGFALFAKRAKVGQAKHIRIRPRFEQWVVRGVVQVVDADISEEILIQLFQIAGSAGLGDWRPSSPKSPGPFGMFSLSYLRELAGAAKAA